MAIWIFQLLTSASGQPIQTCIFDSNQQFEIYSDEIGLRPTYIISANTRIGENGFKDNGWL
jgi:hypothetical protein